MPTSPSACYYTTLGNQKFKFSADIQQIWKKMQINCILSTPILIPLRVQLSVFMCFYQNLVFVAEYHNNCQQTLL